MPTQTTSSAHHRSPILTLIIGLTVVIIFSFGLQIGQMDATIRSFILQSLEPAVLLEKTIASQQEKWQLRWQIAIKGADRLAKLEKLNSQYKKQDELLAQLEKENNLLRSALGQRTNTQQIIVQFYGNGGSWFVNGGAEEGVKVGDLVLHEGVLIGVLQEVYPHYSKVRTVLDQDWRIPVKVEINSPNVQSLAKVFTNGDEVATEESALSIPESNTDDFALGLWQTAKGFAAVTQISQDNNLATGAAILTRGGANLPANLILATVDNWQPHPDGATWYIRANTFVDLSDINLVEIQAR